jgi:hypothetical protein
LWGLISPMRRTDAGRVPRESVQASAALRACDAREELRERRSVDPDRCRPGVLRGGRNEERSMESLVEDAKTVAVPPEDFTRVGRLATKT